MVPYNINAAAWQESWDRQQEAYLPDREERFTAMLDTIDAVTEGHPLTVLDLAGGTGSISIRTLRRFPRATTTLVDLDPVLTAIARESLDERTAVVTADLRDPAWSTVLPHPQYDAVVTATALHWLDGDRLAALYGEIRRILRPGGVFLNADEMPDDGLPELGKLLAERSRVAREARYATGAALSWKGWWDLIRRDESLSPLVARRDELFPSTGSHNEWAPNASWHLDALREAGFTQVGLIWRGGRDAVVAGVR
jgi:ubiquinone/menaquinone biosynthesis C-methylase UbiE